MRNRVVIIGGGLAGLAAASALAPRGFRVTVLESRNRLGGRAGSFQDAASGQLIDACQHVSMGCCTNFAHFCRLIGVDHYLKPQPYLRFMTPDGRISRFQADALPSPFQLVRSFFAAHFLSALEKLRIAWGLACLAKMAPDADPPFLDWLIKHGQNQRTIDRFWSVVLTSALNESCDRIGLRYARKVFVDGFLGHPRGFEVELPVVPLGRFYGEELRRWLHQHDVDLVLNQAVSAIDVKNGVVLQLQLRRGELFQADWYVSSVPFDRLLDLLPPEVAELDFPGLCRLESSPITSVHVWLDRPVLTAPHLVLVDCAGQWVFNRGETAPGEHYLQVVVSAARQFRALGRLEVERMIADELRKLFPKAAKAEILRVRVITEHAATFSAVPGVDRFRPTQATPLGNFFLAGDWTQTGWPATMEGAVRSGYLAAEAILGRAGMAESLVQPDL